jgi:hypothetical protein
MHTLRDHNVLNFSPNPLCISFLNEFIREIGYNCGANGFCQGVEMFLVIKVARRLRFILKYHS